MVAAVPRSGTPEKASALPAAEPAEPAEPRDPRDPRASADPVGPPGWTTGRRVLAAAVAVLAVALLFVAYLQVSRTYPENSDESNDLLMAWDMLHGNVLLHGWYLSDVSFITTELPQWLILVGLFGLHTGTAHIAAAMTYTLVVVLAVLLARGRADQVSRREAAPRMLLTAALVFAPQLGVGVFVLLLSLGHIGTAVPLMLTWLVLDRASPGGRPPGTPRGRGGSPPPRAPLGTPPGATPVVVGLLLTWVLVADPLVLIVGIIPLVAVCALRVIRGARREGLAAQWFEASVAIAALAAEGLAQLVNRLLQAWHAFVLHPVPYQLAPMHTWPKHAWVTAEGLLALFGAKPQGPAPELAFALVHLVGVALVAWAMCRVARRFLSWPDLLSQVLLLAIVINVVAYIPSTLADATDLNAREFAVVLPFGAVLAGRTLAASLSSASLSSASLKGASLKGASLKGASRWLSPVRLAGLVLLACYAAGLGYAAAQPSVPAANQRLVAFLTAHHLTNGIGGYWESSVVTVGSNGAITIRAVVPGTLQPDLWESKASWYRPSAHQATFLVTDSASGFFNHWQPNSAALAAFGPPARTYHDGPYTVYVWDKNLLAQVTHP
jgi:Pentapeptide repeats (8 copies)